MFFSSHQLSEVEMIADHIGIIDRGRMVVSGSLNDIKARYRRLRVTLADQVEFPTRWAGGVVSVRQEGKVVSMLVNGNVEEIIQQVQSMPGTTVESFPVTLKDIFLEQVGGK